MPHPNRQSLALLRGKSSDRSFDEWVQAFGEGDRRLAERYAQAFATFLGEPTPEMESYIGKLSPSTRQAYSYTVTEFFEWTAREHGKVLPPHRVTVADAERYTNWLATRKYSLEEEKLRDGDQPVRLEIYEAVKKLGLADVLQIGRTLSETTRRQFYRDDMLSHRALHDELGRMVLHDLLVRTPTLDELRVDYPQLGIKEFAITVVEGNVQRSVEIEYLFQYTLPKPVPLKRKTIALRVGALSAFWKVLAHGENVPGGEAILRHDVFEPVKRRVMRGLSAESRQAAQLSNRLTPEIVGKMLAATDGKRLYDRRSTAFFWTLVLTGARLSELVKVRRGPPRPGEEARAIGWFDGGEEPPVLVLQRKGGKVQRIPYPPLALRALYAFQTDLESRAAPPEAQNQDPKAAHYVEPDSPRWRFRLLLSEDAPLFPGVAYWGANSTRSYQQLKPNLPHSAAWPLDYRRPLTRHGAYQLVRRIAEKAGLEPAALALVHPHALRAFAATAMARMGKPLREIQALLGHESVTTTERYLQDEQSTVALSGQAEILGYIAQAKVGAPAAPAAERVAPPKKRTVDTYAVPAPDEISPKPPQVREKPQPAPSPRIPPSDEISPKPAQVRETPRAAPAAAPVPARDEISSVPGPELPAQSPVMPDLAEVIHETIEGPIVELHGEAVPAAATTIRDGISPGSPYDVYAGLEPVPGLPLGRRLERQERLEFTRAWPRKSGETKLHTLYERNGREQVQQNPWLRKHYDPWPLHYGLGEGSLLPWYARGNSKANGEVETTVEGRPVVIPPIPVLAPDQVYPETTQPGSLLMQLERLSMKWLETEPTKVYGLRRWYGALAYITARLEKETKQQFEWVPFEGEAKLGEHIRAHDDGYLLRWLDENAGRYTTTVRLFKADIKRPRKIDAYTKDPSERPETRTEDREEADVFIDAFTRTSFESVSQVEEIPEWFASEDPVREIYDRSPEEWGFFLEWLRSVTGAKLSEDRKDNRRDQKSFGEESHRENIERARRMLETYYGYVTDLAEATSAEEAATFDTILHGGTLQGKPVEGLTEQLAKMGVQDPDTREIRKLKTVAQRIETLLAQAFPDATVDLADPNMLRSRLFDADAFRIEPRSHTIRHTDAFRQAFYEEHGRDSECVLRRAARGMWEFVKKNKIEVEPGRKRGEQYAMLHAVMLAYVAWIVPCPADMEKALGERIAGQGRGKASAAYLRAMNQAIREIFIAPPERSEEEIIADIARDANLPALEAARALDIASVMAAEMADHAVPVEVAVSQAVAREELRETRPGIYRRRIKKNAALLVPNESSSFCYRCTETLSISPSAIRHAASLIPNEARIFPSPLRMISAMLAS